MNVLRILLLFVVCYVILGLSFGHSTSYLDIARNLALIGPSVSTAIECCPLVLILGYASVAFVTRKSSARSSLIGLALGVIALDVIATCCPEWLVNRNAQKIEIASFVPAGDSFLSGEEISRFEQAFGTPTAQSRQTGGGPWLVVRCDKYSPSMVAFLKGEAQRRAEAGVPGDRSQPVRPDTNRTSAAGSGR